MAFLVLQEVAWALGVTAMAIHAIDNGPDWIWIGLLTCWQAAILWGFAKRRRAKAR